ncbi:MAG: OB-fold nucleic acid binding domain-containing protein, partial [Anaerolineae bacterium]
MPQIIQIQNVTRHAGQPVTIQGWLYAKTGKGKLQFLQIRDGTGVIQGVMFKPNLPEEVFEAGKRLTQESSIIVSG